MGANYREDPFFGNGSFTEREDLITKTMILTSIPDLSKKMKIPLSIMEILKKKISASIGSIKKDNDTM